MQLAERLSRLGTETAFSVSAEAAAHAAKGNKIYPFHLGDMNLPTPANIVEASLDAIRQGKTGYCPPAGIPELRQAIAQSVGESRGLVYSMENVAVQPGGKPVIGKFLQVLMEPGDEVLYPNPGYPIYESMIEYFGGTAVQYGFIEGENNFEIDLDRMEQSITPKTRILILNSPQNPTGAECGPEELNRIASIVRARNISVLCDEAYFDVRYSGVSGSLASLPGMQERSVILYSFSKKFAMTGWRLGAAIGPKEVIDAIAKLNVNDESCSNHFIQYGALAGLKGDQAGPTQILRTLRERRDAAVKLMNEIPGVRCFAPESTFYLFPNVTEMMSRMGINSYDELRARALAETGVSFCTRLHFGRPQTNEPERYIRLAYSGIDVDQIHEGLGRFALFAKGTRS